MEVRVGKELAPKDRSKVIRQKRLTGTMLVTIG